jgi:hypothetical protein
VTLVFVSLSHPILRERERGKERGGMRESFISCVTKRSVLYVCVVCFPALDGVFFVLVGMIWGRIKGERERRRREEGERERGWIKSDSKMSGREKGRESVLGVKVK